VTGVFSLARSSILIHFAAKKLQQERRRASEGMGVSAEELVREKRDLLL
jgi:hypothetical protein